MDDKNMIEMETYEEGNILQNRRTSASMSLFTIISEILGNLSGKNIYFKYDVDSKILYIFTDDGGFSEDDKKAIILKYRSGQRVNTAGINGIGIRQIMDRISTSDDCILMTINENEKIKRYFRYCEEPSWKTSKEWEDLSDNDIIEYNNICNKCKLENEMKGTYWMIPINDEYHDIFIKEKDNICNMCKRFFNVKITNESLNFYYNDELIMLDKPMCNPKQTINIKYYHRGSQRKNGERFVEIISDDKTEYYSLKGGGKNIKECPKHENVDTCIDSFSVDFSIEEKEIYEDITKTYQISNTLALKGLWLYIDNMSILESPITRQAGWTQAPTSEWCPIINLNINNKENEFFNLDAQKSKSSETAEGKILLKLIWWLFKKNYPEHKNEESINEEEVLEQPILETTPEDENTDDELILDISPDSVSSIEVEELPVPVRENDTEQIHESFPSPGTPPIHESVCDPIQQQDNNNDIYICYIVQEGWIGGVLNYFPKEIQNQYLPENIKELGNLESYYKYGRLTIKNRDKIEQEIISTYCRGRLIPVKIIKYWEINGNYESSVNAENNIKTIIRQRKLNKNNSTELFTNKDSNLDINQIIEIITNSFKNVLGCI